MTRLLPILAVGVVSALWAVPADASAPMLRTWDSSNLRGLVAEVSAEHGLDPRLVDCVVRVESGYNPGARSHKGAMGLMQLMPGTASRHGVSNPYDPEQNVRGGVRELARLLELYAGNLQLALAAYNAGEAAVSKYGGIPPYQETRQYVVKVLSMYNGAPWQMPSGPRLAKPVRMLEDGDGHAVITNYARGAESGMIGAALGGTALLGGGFGR